MNAEHRSRSNQTYATIAGPNGDFAIPTLEELGLQAATTPHRGGETVALKALDAIIADERYTATFEKPKTAPTAFAPQSTTLLSPHMHFGSLSCREFYWRVQDVVSSYRGRDASHPPVSLTGQLLFRDMYFSAHAAIGGVFGQTEGNAHCRFLPWHLPSKVDADTGLATGAYTVDSALAEAWFVRWKEGRTGFPWIDALMRQLAHEGWIHHLGRHAVACFLTRGGAYVSWERGAAVFERLLIDHEAACNIGNWQWLSCTAFFAQFYRCYSPVAFPKKWDPNGDFVRRYVPELARLDKKFIYEPHKAPAAEQRRAGCFVKGDGAGTGTEEPGRLVYPEPMFDFAERRDVCMEAMKEAYRVGLNGNDPRMRDGSWRPLFQGGIHDRILQHAGPGTENEPGEAIGSDADAVPAVALQRESDGDGSGDDDHSSRARVKTRPKKGAKGGVDGGKGAVDGVADSGAADGGAAGRKRQATLTRSGGLELKKARG